MAVRCPLPRAVHAETEKKLSTGDILDSHMQNMCPKIQDYSESALDVALTLTSDIQCPRCYHIHFLRNTKYGHIRKLFLMTTHPLDTIEFGRNVQSWHRWHF